MVHSAEEFKRRTRKFALSAMLFAERMPRGRTADVIGRQFLRAATSVGANYHAACRARSPLEFVAKRVIVEEEADECCYWLDLLIEAQIVRKDEAAELLKEANEITAMAVASIRTARGPRGPGTSSRPAPNPPSAIRDP